MIQRHMKGVCGLFAATVFALALVGCRGSAGQPGTAGLDGKSGQTSNATCLASNCHGNVNLKKTIVRTDAGNEGKEESIPLYVDPARFAATVHGSQLCVSCHTDINASGGAHGPVAKIYGGWARFSAKQAVESLDTNDLVRTRNYYTAASKSCSTCHSAHVNFPNSAHATIFKHRGARIDAALRAAAQLTFPGDTIGELGEDYTAGDCNRCHASCSTCHFKTSIVRAANGNPVDFWDANQKSYPASGFNDKMSEFSMDWTTNVASHDFRKGSYFQNDTEKVCEACHTGFYKPAKNAYYWANDAKTIVKKVKAKDVKRHPQAYELIVSGGSSLTGGNSPHAGFTCAKCHTSLHSLPGIPYTWDAPVKGGDVKCTTCHATPHAASPLKASINVHTDGVGTEVACVGCHAFGMARQFDLANGVANPTSTDVFLDPHTKQVRPVVFKHGIAEAWYPHNWQNLRAGTGVGDKTSDCAKKCHYAGNPVGASAW